MSKRKKLRFRCPFCNYISWESRLKHPYPLELIEVKSDGRGLIKNVFFDWDSKNILHSVFQRHFYDVVEYLLRRRYIDAKTVKNLAEVYLVKDRDVFHPEMVFNPDIVHKPDVVYTPKVVE